MTEKLYLNKIHFLLLMIACTTLQTCDGTNTDDGLVSVRYLVSLSEGANTHIEYFDDDYSTLLRRGKTKKITSDWILNFRVKEFSQILWLSTATVRDGEVKAEIFIDGVLQSSHTNTDSLRYVRSSLAWMPDGGSIYYWVDGGTPSTAAQIKLPSGEISALVIFNTYNGYSNPHGRASLEHDPVAGAPISMSYSKPQNGSGPQCMALDIGYYFPDSDISFRLDSVEQCSLVDMELKVDAIIPDVRP